MLFSDIAIIDENYEYQEHRYVGTAEGRIAYIGAEAPAPELAAQFGEVYDGRGKLLMPGLVNAHTHSSMTLLRGYAENMALDTWLNDCIFPFEAKLQAEDIYPATVLAIAEMLRFGTTSFSDMYYFNDERCKAVADTGIKMNICDTLLDFVGVSYRETDFARRNDDLISRWHGACNDRIRVDYGLHSEYTTKASTVRTMAEEARDSGLIVHVHVSETADEVAACKDRHGMTPPRYLAEMGVFDSPTLAAHCVWLEPGDAELMAQHNVVVATNPISNAKLGSGIADQPYMARAGVRVALGTDSVASNNNLSMFEEMKAFALASRAANCTPVGITPREVLRCATMNGALGQGRTDTGVLACGKAADLVVLNVNVPWMAPAYDMICNVVYSAQGSDVVLTMVDGEVLYRDGRFLTLDVEAAMRETDAARRRVLARL